MADLARLACYQALYNAIAPAVRSQGDGLRGDVDRELRDAYERTGARSYAITTDGVRLGTYTIAEAKAEPARVERYVELVDPKALREWESDDFNDYVSRWIEGNLATLATAYFEETGDLPDGMAVREVEVPAKPASYKCGQVRIDKAFQQAMSRYVAESFGALAPSVVLPALGGDVDA